MKELKGDIWDFHETKYWIVVTTNGFVKKSGEAVMGRGIAEQAKRRYPDLPFSLGRSILKYGNHLSCDATRGLLFFPVKSFWWEKADLSLIERSCQELRTFFDDIVVNYPTPIYLTRPGCGNGRLLWEDVKPVLEKYLDDRFVVVEKYG